MQENGAIHKYDGLAKGLEFEHGAKDVREPQRVLDLCPRTALLFGLREGVEQRPGGARIELLVARPLPRIEYLRETCAGSGKSGREIPDILAGSAAGVRSDVRGAARYRVR